MPRKSYENHTFSVNSALGLFPSPTSQGSSYQTFVVEGSQAASRARNARSRANSTPWNQPPIDFNTNSAQDPSGAPAPGATIPAQIPGHSNWGGELEISDYWEQSSADFGRDSTASRYYLPPSPSIFHSPGRPFHSPRIHNEDEAFSPSLSINSSRAGSPRYTPYDTKRVRSRTSSIISQHDPSFTSAQASPAPSLISPVLSPVPVELVQLPPMEIDMNYQSNSTHDLPNEIQVPERVRRQRRTPEEIVHDTVKQLNDKSRMTPTQFLTRVAVGGGVLTSASYKFFGSGNRDDLNELLDTIWKHPQGNLALREWMEEEAIELVCNKIHREMEAAKPSLRMSAKEVTADFIDDWDIQKVMEPISQNVTPTWSRVLKAATEPKMSDGKAQSLKSRNRVTGRYIISAQAHFLRSFASAKVQIGMGLMAWASGASKQLMNVLHHACLSMSYTSISAIITALADSSIERARALAAGPHGLGYDNINVSSSIYVEQGPNAMSKVQSGTFSVVYKLLNARLEDMALRPMMEKLKKSRPLDISVLRPSYDAVQAFMGQTAVNISRILLKYVGGLDHLNGNPLLQNPVCRMIPRGHKSEFCTLRATTIEEASTEGNLKVHDDVYLVQLKKDKKDLNATAIPCFNDQLTNARIRSGQDLRRQDISSWERREVFMLGFGSFHLNMNLIGAILAKHRGTISQMGSLSHLFAVLEKTRLGGEKPDYHTLLVALTQILEGLILNAWRNECGTQSLSDYAKSSPSAHEILNLAKSIAQKYATPLPAAEFEPIKFKSRSKKPANPASDDSNSESDMDVDFNLTNEPGSSTEEEDSDSEDSASSRDIIYENIVLLTRDLLYVIELVHAMKTGDWGRIEDILPILACMFCGAGSKNYLSEIMFLLFHIKEVWTPEFANIMRDNMLVNPSGLPEHAMGIDLNIEHLIRYLKTLFAAKGIYSNWDRLGNISAGVEYLQKIKKRVAKTVKAGYQGSTHKSVDNSALVWRIADKAKELELQKRKERRRGAKNAKPVPDLHAEGYKKFVDRQLASFNSKLTNMKDGLENTMEEDEPGTLLLDVGEGLDSDSDIDEGDEDTLLHDED